MLKILDCYKKTHYLCRNISICRVALQEENRKTPKRKVKETVELVTLVDQNDKILGLKPKTESEKLAKKSNLQLERVYDSKYGKVHPAYKMVSSSDFLKEEKKASAAKVLKKLPLNSRISDHDLSVKIQTIKRWLDKKCEVHVAVMRNNESEALMKSVSTKMQELLKNESRILDVRQKEDVIKFIVIPPKETAKPVINGEKKTETTEIS